MSRLAPPSLWLRLRTAWLEASFEAPSDPRLAEEAGFPPPPPPRPLPPLVGAHLR
jgi:hypothetical protein